MQKPPVMPEQIITANRLTDGAVVWLTAALEWTTERASAGAFAGDALSSASAQAQQDNANNLVTALYQIALDGKADLSAREIIRANKGPSISPPPDISPPDASSSEPPSSDKVSPDNVSL